MTEFTHTIHHYLAAVYLERNLPKIDSVIKTINSCSPRKNSDGVNALYRLFSSLIKECRNFEDTAYGSYSSELFSAYFGMGGDQLPSPLLTLIKIVIERNKPITCTEIKFLTGFVHGVLLFNHVEVKRVREVGDLLSALDKLFDSLQTESMKLLNEDDDDDDDDDDKRRKESVNITRLRQAVDEEFASILNDFAVHINDISRQMVAGADDRIVSRAKQNFKKRLNDVVTRLNAHGINRGETKEGYDEIDV